ncbi:hypothetical protein M9Y10_041201 [Tritrichomonas musculus]|uniref:ubiquitinyl hydrolase 1 n=1 Tax=Tritrichomonas musculus TaxID=1915356 RepID=A0ABR2K4G8_9EUKA
MKIRKDKKEEKVCRLNFIAPKKREVPNGYFNEHWAEVIIKQNPIRQPLAGLTNFGNSCYINSVLQCLMYCPGLPFFAEHIPNIVYERSLNKHCFLHYFGELSKEMRQSKTCSASVFFHNITSISPEFKPGYQQDAHEFLLSLLNTFDDECARAFNKSHDYFDTAIHALFGSTLTERKICDNCKHITTSESHVLDLSLPLDMTTIEECLRRFMSPADPVSEFKCEKCNSIGTCSNDSNFTVTPPILIITMMRFSSNHQKIEKNVYFEFDLDIKFCSAPDQHTLYELFAIVVHTGHQISFGHFTAAFKIGKSWYSVDDTNITKVSLKSIEMSKPYIMFYRRKNVMEPVYVHFGAPDVDE